MTELQIGANPLKSDLPMRSLRYVKNGGGGRWWKAAKAKGQIHFGWSGIPGQQLEDPGDFAAIRSQIATTQDFNALRGVLIKPSQRLWITFQDGFLWWCTVKDGIEINADGESLSKGHFWLTCDRPWSNRSCCGRLLAMTDLPGAVTATARFGATVCEPGAWRAILRIIRDERDVDAKAAELARMNYEEAVLVMVRRLHPKDFEQLVDLILARTGWTRVSTLGGTQEGIDVEAENLTTQEVAFVQVKSKASQSVLNEYVGRFNERRDRYARMIFAVHSPIGTLVRPTDTSVQVWRGEELAHLAVRLGLGEWVERKVV
ncbi:restriction endonuclease [Bauldia litoralis]|uniref:restriction endonuclease n=1 Tax=Bauldia litoralis TaxID=665467 RepID=UPI0032638DE0